MAIVFTITGGNKGIVDIITGDGYNVIDAGTGRDTILLGYRGDGQVVTEGDDDRVILGSTPDNGPITTALLHIVDTG